MEEASLWALFASAFISSTLAPGGSELVLAYLDAGGRHGAWTLLGVAALGNSLGGMSSWLLGRVIPESKRSRPRVARAIERVRRYGAPVLLLSWLPVVGDPLCVAAGWLRMGWYIAAIYITVGKTVRYAVVLLIA